MIASTQQPIRIAGIDHARGESHPIESLASLKGDARSLEYLTALGLAWFSRISGPMRPLLRARAAACMEKSETPPGEVDAIIHFSTTFDAYKEHGDLAWMAVELGLERALPYGMFLNQCTNYTQAIQFASHLIRNEGMKNVLVLGSDVLDESRADRVMDNRVSVYSDIALAFMVRAGTGAGYRVDGLEHRYLPRISSYTKPASLVQFITAYSEGIRGVCGSLCARLGAGPGSFKRLVTANYNHSVLKNLAQLADMPQNALFLDNIADYGHCFAADQLIALQHMDERNLAEPGDRMLLVAVGGFVIFSSLAVEKCA